MSATAELVQPKAPALRGPSFDVEKVRADFPILNQMVHGKPLIYLDNASSAQKPRPVIEAVKAFYETDYANIHRGLYSLSERATAAYEGAREKVRAFINGATTKQVIFVRSTTEAINLVAATYGRANLRAGDEVLITAMEHHSNIVPWQMVCQQTGAQLKVAPITDAGELDLAAFEALLGPRTKLVSIVHLSNALGTLNPLDTVIGLAHANGTPVLVDGAQAAPHLPLDVQLLDCDFYAFSGHKLYGPSGIGVLYGKWELLEAMEPYQGGGDMIKSVTFERTTYNELPFKFEAGTPNIAGAVGLGAAIDYLQGLGLDKLTAYERELLDYATRVVGAIEGVRLIGTARRKASVLSFVMEGIHPHDIATILDQEGIAVRAGHHCAQPVMARYGLPATVRASFAFYNTRSEIDALAAGLNTVKKLMG